MPSRTSDWPHLAGLAWRAGRGLDGVLRDVMVCCCNALLGSLACLLGPTLVRAVLTIARPRRSSPSVPKEWSTPVKY